MAAGDRLKTFDVLYNVTQTMFFVSLPSILLLSIHKKINPILVFMICSLVAILAFLIEAKTTRVDYIRIWYSKIAYFAGSSILFLAFLLEALNIFSEFSVLAAFFIASGVIAACQIKAAVTSSYN